MVNRGVIVAVAATLLVSSRTLGFPSVYPTGTTIYNPSKAYNCYVLFAAPDLKTHLVDMNGNEVHRWNSTGFPSEMIDPAIIGGERGRIAVQLVDGDSPYGGIFANKSVGELDWDGKVVWQWGAQGEQDDARQNHDREHLPNGNTILIRSRDVVVPEVSKKPIGDQELDEIDSAGKIVWRWAVGDHIREFGISAEGMKILRQMHVNGGRTAGFLTINDMQSLGPNRWYDAGDARFAPENIMIDSREASFIAIIDKKTGKIVWRMGPDYTAPDGATRGTASVVSALRPTLSNTVPRLIDQTSGQHDAHLIAKGLPGEGNLLVFDNEGSSGFPATHLPVTQGSRILEIDPSTKTIVWQYTSETSNRPVWNFFSAFISSARRLPNGNTLIDEGMNGRFFQVTHSGEIVWEYVNPYFASQTLNGNAPVYTNWVFRAQPVPYDWVPTGTPHSETPVEPVDLSTFRVSKAKPN